MLSWPIICDLQEYIICLKCNLLAYFKFISQLSPFKKYWVLYHIWILCNVSYEICFKEMKIEKPNQLNTSTIIDVTVSLNVF